MRGAVLLIFGGVLGFWMTTTPAHAGLEFDDGMWRIEFSATAGVHSGSTDRTGDRLVTGAVDYEVPTTEHLTLGLRLMPLMVYDQDGDADTVWGAGLGLTARLYLKEEYKGLFVEGEGNLIVHRHKIEGNSATGNFLIGMGVGYQFESGWHATLKYSHISNAGLGENNRGANSLGIGLGFRF